MRARINTHTSIDGAASTTTAGEADANGKDKPKFKRPKTASFKLPPPPKILVTSMAFRTGGGPEASSKASADAPISEVKSSERAIDYSAASALPPVLAVTIPPPPSTASAVYQRANRIPRQSDSPAAVNALVPPGYDDDAPAVKQKANSRDSCSNAYQARQYPHSSSYSQITHPYQPSSWYVNNRNTQRNRQLLKKVFGAVLAVAVTVLTLWALQYLKSIEHAQTHHVRYHHHDHRHHIHPMMGIIESPLGFSKDMARQEKGYRELEQEHTAPERQQKEGGNDHELFSTFPVTTLSNGRLLPFVGFGVSSDSVEHKSIPTIVSTLLQYASSETLGGGGIAMIDAVVHEEGKLDLDGQFKPEDEKMESSLEKTVVALVGRSINYFGKEHIKESKGLLPGKSSVSNDKSAPYDYENRLEVHVLLGLVPADLGAENTMAALQDFAAELDGIVPSFLTDMFNADLSESVLTPSLLLVDHHVDVRLHVLVRLSLCHDRDNHVAPCSFDEETNKELLESFLASYALLERLYDHDKIHGIGLEGVRADDIQYLLDNCKVKPQLYRGNMMQALDIYGRHHGRPSWRKHALGQVLRENNITFLASNAAGTILSKKDVTPNAYALLQNLGGVLYRAHLESAQSGKVTSSQKGDGQYYTVPKLVLSYLVRHKVCVLPHVYKAEHLADDAPESVAGLAHFLSERRMAEIGAGIRALLSEIDLPEDHGLGTEGEKEVAGVFHNLMMDEVHVFRVRDNYSTTRNWEIPGENDGNQVWTVQSLDSVVIIAKAGDVFRAHGPHGDHRGTYEMTDEEGGCTEFNIVPPLDYIIEDSS